MTKNDSVTTFPLFVMIINTKCNQRCIYCPPMGEGHICKPGDLNVDEAKLAMNRAFDAGFRNFRISGGEPLVHPKFKEFLSALGNIITKGAHVIVNTNGVLLDRYIYDIVESRIAQLRVSLDSLNEKTYMNITGTDTLNKVLSNIDIAIKLKVPVRINMVVMKSNINEVKNFIEYSIKKKCELKLLDLEQHDYDYQKVWESEFVPLEELKQKIGKLSDSSNTILSWGGKGMPMSSFAVGGINVVIKDSLVGSTYNNYCRLFCDRFPCPEGVYDLLLNPNNEIVWCRRNPKTNFKIDTSTNSVDDAIKEGLAQVLEAKLIEHSTISETYKVSTGKLLPIKEIRDILKSTVNVCDREANFYGDQARWGRDDY